MAWWSTLVCWERLLPLKKASMPSYVGYTCKSIIDEHKDPKSLTVRTFINCTFVIIRLLNNYNTFRNNTVIHVFFI